MCIKRSERDIEMFPKHFRQSVGFDMTKQCQNGKKKMNQHRNLAQHKTGQIPPITSSSKHVKNMHGRINEHQPFC